MLFDFSNYWAFLLLISALYVAISTFFQSNIGGKNRLRNLQQEMRQSQLKMMDATKNKRDKEAEEASSHYFKLTSELMVIQFQMLAVLLVVLVGVGYLFPFVEPGAQDDINVALHDDGLAQHCDAAAGDNVHSGCLPIPKDAEKGAWVVDAYLNSSTGELLSRQGHAIYHCTVVCTHAMSQSCGCIRVGSPEDVWLQSFSQSGLLDGILGKAQYHLNVTTDKQDYSGGETVKIFARPHKRLFTSGRKVSEAMDAFAAQGMPLSPAEVAGLTQFLSSSNRSFEMRIENQLITFQKDGEGVLAYSYSAPQGATLEASANAGTFFYLDLPFTLPLINIRRIIGSYGVFLFTVFALSMLYTIGKSVYARFKK